MATTTDQHGRDSGVTGLVGGGCSCEGEDKKKIRDEREKKKREKRVVERTEREERREGGLRVSEEVLPEICRVQRLLEQPKRLSSKR